MSEFQAPHPETDAERQAAYKAVRKVATKLVFEHERQQGEPMEYEGIPIIMALGLTHPEHPDMTISLMRSVREGKSTVMCDLQDQLKEDGDIHSRTIRYTISADGVIRNDSAFKIWSKEYEGLSTDEINNRLAFEALASNMGTMEAVKDGINSAPITAEEANALAELLQQARPMESPEQAA
jgi:hypothetical protein